VLIFTTDFVLSFTIPEKESGTSAAEAGIDVKQPKIINWQIIILDIKKLTC